MKRLFVSALGISPPGTLGGNSKITLEIVRHLAGAMELHVLVPEKKAGTFTENLPELRNVFLHRIPGYEKESKFRPVSSTLFYAGKLERVFRDTEAGPEDIVFSCSDFHEDVLPVYRNQKRFGFRWIPSMFLFVPGVFENLRGKYGFPVVKYAVYFLYQRALFGLMLRRASAFVVTNRCDFRRFPRRFRQGAVFDMYGGVNVEQIERAAAESSPSAEKRYDAVFCSRLHPQKGIWRFLDVWKRVVDGIPSARLAVIGNGGAEYERALREKAGRLGIAGNVEWLGYVNNEAKYKIYLSSKIFVHPTVYDNNGMVAAEALCTGLPVVMYDLANLRDVYTAGCVKVPEGDSSAMAESLTDMIRDRDRLAEAAPSEVQTGELRAKWRWESRIAEFGRFLSALPDGAPQGLHEIRRVKS